LNVNDHIALWNQAVVKVMDVRFVAMSKGERTDGYRMPAASFLFVAEGRGRFAFDGREQAVRKFRVLHCGKGTCLDVLAEETLEFYWIFYKAGLPSPERRDWLRLMERNDPFASRYALDPADPRAVLDLFGKIARYWETEPESRLYVKSLFYELLHELLKRPDVADAGAGDGPGDDPAGRAVRYIRERYGEPITLESLAEALGCHPRRLLRTFKSARGTSPIDYLIQVRMERAKELLRGSDLSLKKIAEKVGYSDSYYFSRMFKKIEGVSPTGFKANAGTAGRNNPSRTSGYPIVSRRIRRYAVNDFDNHYQYRQVGEGEGNLHMQGRSRAFVFMTLLFCLALMLSACGSGSGNKGQASGSAPASQAASPSVAPSASASASPSAASEAPRTIKHAMGEETLTGTPQRVVILTNEGTEALLTVGIKPVGAVQSWIGDPWYDHIKDEMEGVTAVGDELQPNIELIASLKPDLIIGNKVRQEKIYEQLKQIAPTVFAEDLGGDWKVNFKLYSEAVNKAAEGEQAMAAFDKRVEEVKSKLGDKAATQVSLVRFSAAQVRIYQKQTFAGVLLNQLGIARPASQDKDAFIEVMTKERIPDMDGDVLFYFVSENVGSTDAANVVKEWMDDPLFKNLGAAKSGKVIQVNEAIWNTAGGYEAANLLLDELVKYFDVK